MRLERGPEVPNFSSSRGGSVGGGEMGGFCGPLEPQRAAAFLLGLIYFPNLLEKKIRLMICKNRVLRASRSVSGTEPSRVGNLGARSLGLTISEPRSPGALAALSRTWNPGSI